MVSFLKLILLYLTLCHYKVFHHLAHAFPHCESQAPVVLMKAVYTVSLAALSAFPSLVLLAESTGSSRYILHHLLFSCSVSRVFTHRVLFIRLLMLIMHVSPLGLKVKFVSYNFLNLDCLLMCSWLSLHVGALSTEVNVF